MGAPHDPPPRAGIDDERMAALLSGNVTGAERDELLAALAVDDEHREVFGNTASALRAMEEEDATAASPPEGGNAARG